MSSPTQINGYIFDSITDVKINEWLGSEDLRKDVASAFCYNLYGDGCHDLEIYLEKKDKRVYLVSSLREDIHTRTLLESVTCETLKNIIVNLNPKS